MYEHVHHIPMKFLKHTDSFIDDSSIKENLDRC